MKAAWENDFYIMNNLSGVRYNINITEVMEEGASESVHLPPAAPKAETTHEPEEQAEPVEVEQAQPEEPPAQPAESAAWRRTRIKKRERASIRSRH